ncbi:MAG: GldG family protein [Myxococcales bacterium]|nr:GldG family protein [Myxococcales bacterium]
MSTEPRDERPTAKVDEARRTARINTYVGSLLAVLIVVMVNYLAFRHHKRWDFTSESLFTLSERTLEALRELDRDVTIYLLLSKGERVYRDVDELLSRYADESDHIQIERVDPDREASRFLALVDQLKLGYSAAQVAAVVKSGDRSTRIQLHDLMTPRFGDEDGPTLDIEAERAFTGAILDLTQGEPSRVCVTSGHGEWSADAGGARGLAAYREDLEPMNVVVQTIETVGTAKVPDHCSMVAVIGPQRPFTKAEVEVLERYVRGGGNLLLAFDPILEGGTILHTGFETFLATLGIDVEPTIVLELDPAKLLGQSPIEEFIASQYGDHETMEPFQLLRGPLALHFARSVRVRPGSKAGTLFSASPLSVAESDVTPFLEGTEYDPERATHRGNVPLGAAITLDPPGDEDEEQGAKRRIVVLGDADIFREPFLMQPALANHHVVSALTGFLLEKRALAAIPPRKSQLDAIMMTSEDRTSVAFRVLVLLPLAALLLGVAAYWGRRK